MNYLDVYKARVGHLGATPQERAYKSGILEFRRYLKYNQHTVHNLILDDNNESFDGVILTDKEDENRVSQILLVKVIEDGGPELKQGDLIWWGEDSNPWIIWRSTTSSYQPHQKFYMVRCNYNIKWVDEEGDVQSSWIYLLGHKDSKIKDNFRTWNNLITPQPNKYINIMLPFRKIKQGTEIMVLDEVWSLVDDDRNSVPGISFMSFTETNLNEQRDDIINSLPNADNVAGWVVSMPSHRHVKPNETFEIEYSILKNGVEVEAEPIITVSKNFILKDKMVTVGDSGSGNITISYMGRSAVQIVQITNEDSVILTITGDEKIRTGRTLKYKVNGIEPVEFSVDNINLCSVRKLDDFTCELVANSRNEIGKVVLKAKTALGKETSKIIEVVPLWQVN